MHIPLQFDPVFLPKENYQMDQINSQVTSEFRNAEGKVFSKANHTYVVGRSDEDRHYVGSITMKDPTGKLCTLQLNGVFDGHGGKYVSNLLKQRFFQDFETLLGRMCSGDIDAIQLTEFYGLDGFLKKFSDPFNYGDVQTFYSGIKNMPFAEIVILALKKTEQSLNTCFGPNDGGSTAAICVICPEHNLVISANTGDSEVHVIGKDCVFNKLPPWFYHDVEDTRSVQAWEYFDMPHNGQAVFDNASMNGLRVARSFGDKSFGKKNDKAGGLYFGVLPELACRVHRLSDVKYILMMSDGIDEGFTYHQTGDLMEYLTNLFKQEDKNFDGQKVINEITQQARTRGSTDDLTAIVISFPQIVNGPTYYKTLPDEILSEPLMFVPKGNEDLVPTRIQNQLPCWVSYEFMTIACGFDLDLFKKAVEIHGTNWVWYPGFIPYVTKIKFDTGFMVQGKREYISDVYETAKKIEMDKPGFDKHKFFGDFLMLRMLNDNTLSSIATQLKDKKIVHVGKQFEWSTGRDGNGQNMNGRLAKDICMVYAGKPQ